ncbi:hypothetical protein ABT063_44700 [Streptomyces sp. NPDC002838]|uniref:hypothetical protein n=1 Tax=Streptomyces sp. NPDC002838 TaxID=3154436 RepID=UPI003333960C
MNADPTAEPDLLSRLEAGDLLAKYEAVAPMPVRPEYIEGRAYVPLSPPDRWHSDTAGELAFQLHSAGIAHAGKGNGFRFADEAGGTTALARTPRWTSASPSPSQGRTPP